MESATRCHSLPYNTRLKALPWFPPAVWLWLKVRQKKTINHHESTDGLYFKCIEMCPNPKNLLFWSSHGWNPNKKRLLVVAFLIRNESQASTGRETLALPESPAPCSCINSHGNMSELFYLSVARAITCWLTRQHYALWCFPPLSPHNWNYSKQLRKSSTFPFKLWKIGCFIVCLFWSVGCLCTQKA